MNVCKNCFSNGPKEKLDPSPLKKWEMPAKSEDLIPIAG